MKKLIVFMAAAGFLLAPGLILAGSGKVMIESPKDGAAVEAGKPVEVKYHATEQESGDHLHLSVDGKHKAVIMELHGTTTAGPFKKGAHKICLGLHTKSHQPRGIESCVNINVK